MARRCNIVNDLVVASMISFEISFDLLRMDANANYTPGAISSMRVFDPNDTASYICLGTLAVY